jgi:hypothetical protein
MNQHFRQLVFGLMLIGIVYFSVVSISATAQNESTASKMTPGGQNETLEIEGTSGLNQSVARNESAGGGGIAPG